MHVEGAATCVCINQYNSGAGTGAGASFLMLQMKNPGDFTQMIDDLETNFGRFFYGKRRPPLVLSVSESLRLNP